MEKICIVKRRRRDLSIDRERAGEKNVTGMRVHLSAPPDQGNTGPKDPTRTISIDLTPEQSKVIRSCDELSPGRTCVIDVETAQKDGEHVVFNFRLVPLYGGRMLNSLDVCNMLQISKWSLRKLVRMNEMDSYRVGRLRRFLLEDVLHYLSHSRETRQNNDHTGAGSTDAGIH
jgi:excisionase family DNA binding protein